MRIKRMLFYGLLVCHFTAATAQQKEAGTPITAEQIIQRAIDSAGGDAKLEAVKSAEVMSQFIIADKDTLSIAIKRKGNNKYYISMMSFPFENTTTVFNNGEAVLLRKDTAEKITDPVRSGNRYYCHYITSDDQAGTCAFEKVD